MSVWFKLSVFCYIMYTEWISALRRTKTAILQAKQYSTGYNRIYILFALKIEGC
jgi:hypothetical protein